MSKQNAYSRRKSRSQMRKSKKQERAKIHLANCEKMERRKRKEGIVKVMKEAKR
jgi:hypothetical protein